MTPTLPVLEEADVAVIGGGPSGAIAAFTLASKGHDVVLIDKQTFPRDKACGDGLTSSTVSFLRQLGLDEVLAGGYRIEATRLVVDWLPRETKRSSSRVSLGCQQRCCLPRRTFDDALVRCARTAGARFLRGTVTEPILSEGSVVGVELLHNGLRTSVLAHHLIAADGSTSRLRRQMSLSPRPQVAASYAARRYVNTQEPLERVFDIYMPVTDSLAGYGWVFPVSDHVANIGIGYVTARGLPRPRPITDLLDSFLASLQRHRGSELGSLEPLSSARGAPVGVGFSADCCEIGGIIFVGDAARTCDPITGEGIDQAMRSAHASALALHRVIKRGAKPVGVGRVIARSNPRLGQDTAMMARLGHQLLKRRSEQSDSTDVLDEPMPFFSVVRSMVTAEVDYPTMSLTPTGDVASHLGFAELLSALDDRVRDQVRSEFILCSELLHREVCAGIGPLGALVLFSGQAACGEMADDRSVDAAVSLEFLQVFTTMLSRVTKASNDQARANNALTVTIGDFALSRAIGILVGQGSAFSSMLADAIEASGEAAALLAQDRPQMESPVRRYIEWARLTSGEGFALAARMGARLAGAHQMMESFLCAAGKSLGIAVQICEDILALRRQDPIVGRAPWRALEQGHFGLPVLLAAEEEQRIASLLVTSKTRAEWEGVVDVVMNTGGLERADEMCREYADSAKKTAVETVGKGTPFEALCNLPLHCLTPSASPSPTQSRISPAASPAAPAAKDVALRAAS